MTLDEARTLVWEFLATRPVGPDPGHTAVPGIDLAVAQRAQALGLGARINGTTGYLTGHDSLHVRTVIGECVVAGILVWGNDALGAQSGPPHLQITAFGRQCLASGQTNPYDPEGYMRKLLLEVPPLDPVAREYLSEALVCLHRTCYRACAVMLGGASETVMLRLIEAFHDALPLARQGTFAAGAMEPLSIARRVRFFRQELERIRLTIPQPLRDNLGTQLDGIFMLIRMERNDAGHPNVTATTRETAHANLLLFPSYGAAAYALIAHLQANPIP
jgi:hypothetical protein